MASAGICAVVNVPIVLTGTVIGGAIGLAVDTGQSLGELLGGIVYAKPPANAWDPNGAKAPGYPGGIPGYTDPKGGPNWVPNPNGSGNGWESGDGTVWIPTGWAGAPGTGTVGPAHGGPHWDVQTPGGGYENVRPPQ